MTYFSIQISKYGSVGVLPAKKVPDLEYVHKFVDCDIVETVNLRGFDGDFIMLVDEEGWLKPDPVLNVTASLLYRGTPFDIAGNALILKRNRYDWEALTANECEYLLREINATIELFKKSL